MNPYKKYFLSLTIIIVVFYLLNWYSDTGLTGVMLTLIFFNIGYFTSEFLGKGLRYIYIKWNGNKNG